MHAKHTHQGQNIFSRWRTLRRLVIAAITLVVTSSCNNASTPPTPTTSAQPPTPLPHATTNKLTIILWQSQQLQLDRAIQHANTLTHLINSLPVTPSDQDLNGAQDLWQTLALSLEKLSIFGALASLQNQQSLPNWQTVTTHYRLINTWPSELGVLDNNGTHGDTGLVFNMGIAIDEPSLTPLHNQTHHQDAVFGLYPLGLMLMGAHTPRQASQFNAIIKLSKEHKAQGLNTPQEHPQNRRRQLITTQIHALGQQLEQLKSLLQNRDNNSALNAFSQSSAQRQQLELLNAAQQLAGLQLQELAQLTEPPLWQQQWQYQRLHAQITGLEQWLSLLGNNQAATLCQTILQSLANNNLIDAQLPHLSSLSTTSTPTSPPLSSSTATSHATTAQPFRRQLKQQLAGLTLALKQAIQTSSPNPTK